MKIDLLQRVVSELAVQIAGSRIAKIHQPSADLFILRLWTGRENLKLLISASGQESRIHLTEQSFPNPFTPPRFCQLLRARVSGILGIQLLNDDRIVEITCRGPKGNCRLLVELIGKSSNLILLDADGHIIDALKRQAGGRVSPGALYVFPDKPDRSSDVTLATVADLSVSEAVGKLYTEQAAVSTTDLRSRLEKLLRKELKKLARRLKNIQQEHDRQQDFEQYRQQGDLLLANMHLLKRGMQEAEVVNYYQQPPIDIIIPLDPLLTPQDNADRFFRKYKKARRGLEHSARRLAETDQEIQWLDQLAYQLNVAEAAVDIALIADELKRAGLLKEKTTKLPRSQKSDAAGFKETVGPGGCRVMWGTNSKQNDALSTKVLKRGDLWFHAHRCPGSHVVLKADGVLGVLSDDDIVFAASVAAANSKAKLDLKVEVMIAEAKDLKKPPRAKPGMVTVSKYKTIVVKPLVDNADVF